MLKRNFLISLYILVYNIHVHKYWIKIYLNLCRIVVFKFYFEATNTERWGCVIKKGIFHQVWICFENYTRIDVEYYVIPIFQDLRSSTRMICLAYTSIKETPYTTGYTDKRREFLTNFWDCQQLLEVYIGQYYPINPVMSKIGSIGLLENIYMCISLCLGW
jgi:hypothetical protein